jgi:predicted dehydrogenase
VSTEPRRVAVVGLGIGQLHLIAWRKLKERAQVVAVCDPDPQRAAQVAERLPDVAAYSDLGELLQRDDLEVVDLCTPPFLHVEQTLQVLERGAHVICEKPLAGSLADVDRIAAAEVESGRLVMPVFQYRFGHGLQKMRHLVESGVTGKAYASLVELFWTRGADYYEVPWRGKWDTELGGIVVSHALHLLDMLTYVVGPVASVSGRVTTRVNDIETEDCAAVAMTMADGSVATLTSTLGSADELSRLRFAFEKVTAESSTAPYDLASEPWTFSGEAASALEGYEPGPEGYLGQWTRFLDALDAGTEPPVTLADARASIELATAIYAASAERREADLPFPDDHPFYRGWTP